MLNNKKVIFDQVLFSDSDVYEYFNNLFGALRKNTMFFIDV